MNVKQFSFLAFLIIIQKPAREHGNAAAQFFGEAARFSSMGIMATETFSYFTGGD